MRFFNKLERRFGRYAIHNLMYYIIIMYVIITDESTAKKLLNFNS